jgi:hypothetical protein
MKHALYQIQLSKDDYAVVHSLARKQGVSVKKIISDAIRESYSNKIVVHKQKEKSTKELIAEIHEVTKGISLKGLDLKKLAHEGHRY